MRRRPTSLQTRVFAWFGVTIVASSIVVALGFAALSDHQAFDEQLREGGRWLGARFESVWDDPAARAALAAETASAFDVSVTLRGPGGQVLHQAGPDCRREMVRAEVVRGAEVLGSVSGCPGHSRQHGAGKLVPFLLALMVLWGGAGIIARRLARPLVRLQRVANDLGEGKLASRVDVGRRPPPEVQQVADTFNKMADRLERQIADQKELLAAVSHEMRTPLGHMRLLIETARERWAAQAGAAKTLDNLEREIVELDALTGQLLASARLELADPARMGVVAGDLARDALERQGLPAELLVVDDEVSLALDPTLMGRALANLLDNAERHAGGATMLRVRATDEHLIFEVGDDGEGPPGAEAWEAFRQGAADKARLKRGSLGLGLALVRRIAEAHDGEAYAERRPEGGALYAIKLPRAV